MIFNCPECDKKYILSATALGAAGKTVRCVNCRHEWFQQPEVQQDVAPEETAIQDDDEWDDADDVRETANDHLEGFFDKDDDSDFDESDVEQTNGLEPEDGSNENTEKPLEQIIQEISEKNNSLNNESIEEEAREMNSADMLDIPQGVRPIPEEEADSSKSGKDKKQKKTKKEPKSKKAKTPQTPKKSKAPKERVPESAMARLMGFAAAIVIFIGFMIFAIFAKPQILSAWPAAASIYELAGMSVAVEGDELIIESLTAELSGDKKTLNIKGNIVNLNQEDALIPPMVASFNLGDDNGAQKWVFTTPQETVDGEGSVEFTSSYDSPPDDVSMINVTFEKIFK